MCHQVFTIFGIYFQFPSTYMYMYILLNNTHTHRVIITWSVRFSLTIITYVLHFLYNQQNYIITVYETKRGIFTIKLLLNQQQQYLQQLNFTEKWQE